MGAGLLKLMIEDEDWLLNVNNEQDGPLPMPKQYARMVEKQIAQIADLAEEILPVITELGASVTIEFKNVIIAIERRKL